MGSRPYIATNDHSDHMSGDTVIGSDYAVRPSRIFAYGFGLFPCELIPGMATFVGTLLFACSPFAISWRVALFVINALQRISGRAIRALTHIKQEISKGVPAFADFYTSVSVVFTLVLVGAVTTPHHTVPNKVFWSLGHIVSPIGDGSSGEPVLTHRLAATL